MLLYQQNLSSKLSFSKHWLNLLCIPTTIGTSLRATRVFSFTIEKLRCNSRPYNAWLHQFIAIFISK